MEKQFVTFEIAKQLRDLGFDDPCLAWYYFDEETKSYTLNSFKQEYGDKFDWWKYSELDSDVYVDNLIAPLWQQVIDWFREKHSIEISICYWSNRVVFVLGGKNYEYLIHISTDTTSRARVSEYSDSYKEVREQAILKAIEIIKTNNK